MQIDVNRKIREPSSRWDVEAATGLKRDSLLRELGTQTHPHAALEFVDREFIQGGDGTGLHFYFPLTRMKYMGEFFKGALSVMAPEARTTLLKTPYHEEMFSNLDTLKRNPPVSSNE